MCCVAVCRYQEANARNQALQEQQAQKNGELEQLRERRDRLLADCRSSALRMEAVRLHEQQAELDARREALEKELREQRTPAEERDRLLTQLKADNQETALLERQIAEASQQLEQVQDQLRNLEQESDEALQLGTSFFSLLHFAISAIHLRLPLPLPLPLPDQIFFLARIHYSFLVVYSL